MVLKRYYLLFLMIVLHMNQHVVGADVRNQSGITKLSEYLSYAEANSNELKAAFESGR